MTRKYGEDMIYKNFELYNVFELVPKKEQDGFLMSRIPKCVRSCLNQTASTMAFNGCGVEIRFNIINGPAKVVISRDNIGAINPMGIVEIYYGSFQASNINNPVFVGYEQTEFFINTPPNIEKLLYLYKKEGKGYDPRLIRILLPHDAPTILHRVEGDIVPPQSSQKPCKKIVFYGSSITHGGNAISTRHTYASQLADMLNFELINLAFAGSAYMDIEMAEFISTEINWDIAVLEMGINVLDKWTANEYKDHIECFICEIAERNQEKKIFCTDIYTFGADFFEDSKANQFRDILYKVIKRRRYDNVIYIPGYKMLKSVYELSSDLVHPSQEGMNTIAKNLFNIINSYL